MLLVNWIISGLVVRQRSLRRAADRSAQREQRLRHWGDLLRDTDNPITHAGTLRDDLRDLSRVPVALLLQPAGAAPAEPVFIGEPDADQRAGLALCARDGRSLGPGSGRRNPHCERQGLALRQARWPGCQDEVLGMRSRLRPVRRRA